MTIGLIIHSSDADIDRSGSGKGVKTAGKEVRGIAQDFNSAICPYHGHVHLIPKKVTIKAMSI